MKTNQLSHIQTATWDALSCAVSDTNNAFQYLTLSTVSVNHTCNAATEPAYQPQARLLVLRKVDSLQHKLEFHTDIRSPKWFQLQHNPTASVTGYDPTRRLQLRLQGTVTLLAPDTNENSTAWSALSDWTKSTYCVNAPGEPADAPMPSAIQIDQIDVERGRTNFGVLSFQATLLDWFQLERGNNKRAVFRYRKDDNEPTGNWVTP